MSSRPASARAHVDATPTPERSRPDLQKTDTAVRACVGRYTVDLVAGGDHLLAAVGRGAGTAPVLATIGPAVAVALLKAAAASSIRAWLLPKLVKQLSTR